MDLTIHFAHSEQQTILLSIVGPFNSVRFSRLPMSVIIEHSREENATEIATIINEKGSEKMRKWLCLKTSLVDSWVFCHKNCWYIWFHPFMRAIWPSEFLNTALSVKIWHMTWNANLRSPFHTTYTANIHYVDYETSLSTLWMVLSSCVMILKMFTLVKTLPYQSSMLFKSHAIPNSVRMCVHIQAFLSELAHQTV